MVLPQKPKWLCTHAEATHVWETADFGLLPFKQSCKCCFVVAVGGCKGLLGKTDSCRIVDLDVASV